MGSVNRVWLMGWVARPPVVVERLCRLVVATREGEHIERHTVTVPGELVPRARNLETGVAVYVEGRLEHYRGLAHVAAEELWRVSEPVVDEATEVGVSHGTHAPPRPHERRGHWRRVATATPAERLVWVRATTVGA